MASLNVPAPILAALRDGFSLAVSISGGKDSQAMLSAVVRFWRENNFSGRIFAIHADLGRAEWKETPAVVENQAKRYGVDLVVVQRSKGDLFQRIEARLESVSNVDGSKPAKPFWPSSQQRYCTSDLKRDPINKYLRTFEKIVSAIGIRRQESSARSKKPCWQENKRISNSVRDALIWHPVLDWNERDVWNELGVELRDLEIRRNRYRAGHEAEAVAGFPAHPAYVYGNERLSCALCVLASRNDLENGARHNPEAYEFLVDLERRSGYTFRADLSLEDLILTNHKTA